MDANALMMSGRAGGTHLENKTQSKYEQTTKQALNKCIY